MSREIKFRAWDKKLNTIINNIQNQYCTDQNVVYRSFRDILESGNPIMQYTGLKDKNGTEIYEGDIVKDRHGLSKIVVHHSDFSGDKFCQHYEGNPSTGPNSNGMWELGFYSNGEYMEVIGNIYENKELLELPNPLPE